MDPKLTSLDQVKASAEETENKGEDETILHLLSPRDHEEYITQEMCSAELNVWWQVIPSKEIYIPISLAANSFCVM